NPDLALLGTGRRPAPEFPADLLGAFWSRWAMQRARAASAPIDYVAVALLASAGAAIANVRWPVAGATWSEPPLLWCGLVGSPSSGKSPAMDASVDLIRHAEDQMGAGFEAVMAEYESKRVAAEVRRELWERAVEAAIKAGESPPPMTEDAEAPALPVQPRIRVTDATLEKLGLLAAGLPRGLLLVRDELAGWLGAFDRYGGAGADRAFSLEMYGGRAYAVDRVKHAEPIRIRHLSVGVLGSIQPDRLAGIIDGPEDGLVARFLWCWPEAIPDFALARTPIEDAAAREAFSRLITLALDTDEFDHPEPRRVRLSAAAENALEEFAREMARRAHAAEGIHAGVLGKARGHALRLATVLEILWWAAVPNGSEPTNISEQALIAACALMDAYFLPMAERVFGDASLPVAERRAMLLARHLNRAGVSAFNTRDLRRQIGGALREAAAMQGACTTLVEAGLIRPQFTRAGDHRGRTAQNYEVNPSLLGRAV
ncbi:MAG TPA: DUF3987 domain-containing protein, partial [Salinarimonas sp.]|nr:DUF3987 domain-containing protein [Salinarimonas sp.]